jgi:hypothetical protein
MKSSFLIIVGLLFFVGCNREVAVPIDESTFVYGSKVYHVVDNEVMQISDLNSDHMRKFDVNKVQSVVFGETSLAHVKKDATAYLTVMYRNNKMYYRLEINGLNNLREDYDRGTFTIEFRDSSLYLLHSIPIETSDLIASVRDDEKHTVTGFFYQGSADMTLHTFELIHSYAVSSSVSKKATYNDWFKPYGEMKPPN